MTRLFTFQTVAFPTRLITAVIALTSALTPTIAGAQTPVSLGPDIEIGADATMGVPDGDLGEKRIALSPRLTWHLAPRNSLVFFGEVAGSEPESNTFWERTQMFGVEFRRALYERGGFSLSGLAGAGLARQQIHSAEIVVPGPVGGSVSPELLRQSYWPIADIGVNVEQRLASHLSVHGDVVVVGGSNVSELRARAGFSVPVRPYALTRTDVSAAYGATPLRTGQKLWISDRSGRDTAGVISAIDSNRIEVTTSTGRESFARSDIARLAIPDSLVNGTAIGAGIGAGSLGAFVGFIGTLICEGECENIAGPVLLGSAYGAAFGALTGAIVDSLIDRPRTVFGTETGVRVNITPSLGRHSAGGRVQLSW